MSSMNGVHLYYVEGEKISANKKLVGSAKTRNSIAKISAKIRLKEEELITLRDGKGKGRHSNTCWQETQRIIDEEEKKLRELQVKLERQLIEENEIEENQKRIEDETWREQMWESTEGFEEELIELGLERTEGGAIRAKY